MKSPDSGILTTWWRLWAGTKLIFRREDESEGEDDEEYRFDENDAAEIANANEAAQLDADLEKLNSSEEVTDEDLSELYAEQCVDNKDISEDDQVKCRLLSSALKSYAP